MARRFENGADLRGPLLLNGSAGTSGQVPLSAGPGAIPTWGSPAGLTVTEVALNFGANPQWATYFQITTPATPGQVVLMAASASNGDELEFDNFTCSARVTATNTVEAWVTAMPGPVAGSRNFTLTIA